ncbi:MAG TPA: hypothetical protein VEB20_26205 [Azospirillaceae bacterium]|nr:hypothetical protein [Azospirillaceae bacterium]
MIDSDLLRRYLDRFGSTFTVAYWDQRPGDRLNEMMRAALDHGGPLVTDAMVADDLALRLHPDA